MENQTNEQKFLINCSHGGADVERATIAFILAASSSKTAETAVFATADAAQICVKGGADGMAAPGYEPLDDLMRQFHGNGGRIWLCPACAKARGITADDLREGVEIAGAPRTMAFLSEGARVLA